ncbi:torsin-1A [Procambarus clarkii]|uniref:torsin-1A n=1 Tax=Procambarus clarkii TaxID=6728 RepID=UPI001E675CB5|nr:torsin-1A-like [Procambarus clarkii]
MEGFVFESSGSPRNKPSRRSLSLQPELSPSSSSLHSARKKLRGKSPGRNLTAFFTHKSDRFGRASVDDCRTSLRRRTVGSVSSNLLQLTSISEVSGWNSLSRSFSTPTYTHNNNKTPLDEPDESEESSVSSDDSDGHSSFVPEEHEHHAHKRLFTDFLKNDNSLMLQASSSRKKQRISEKSSNQDIKNPSLLWKLIKAFSKIVMYMIVLLFSLLFLTVGLSQFFVYQKAKCEEKKNMVLPLDNLKDQLSLYVIGQEMAIGVIINSLKKILPNKIERPSLLWMVGWTGSGKTHTTHIIKNILSGTSQVHIIIPDLLPEDTGNLHGEMTVLFHKLDPCSLNLVIIDGWDDESNFPIKVLEHFFINFENSKTKSQIVIILSGTRGSAEIGEYFLKLRNSGKSRKDFTSEDFIDVTASLKEVNLLKKITEEHTLVPYLPLEVPHIKLCIKEELKKLQKLEIIMKEDKLQKITQQIIDQLSFLPTSYLLVAASGCKRVQPLLALLLSGHR